MDISELKEDLRSKMEQCGFSRIDEMVEYYGQSKFMLCNAIAKMDAIIKSNILKKEGKSDAK